MVSLYFVIQRNIYHLSCGHRLDTVAIAIIAIIAIPSFHIKYSSSDKTCQQVGRPILSNICTLGGGESIFVQISDIYVNWS